jgi:hypothetical protein
LLVHTNVKMHITWYIYSLFIKQIVNILEQCFTLPKINIMHHNIPLMAWILVKYISQHYMNIEPMFSSTTGNNERPFGAIYNYSF